MTLEQLAIEAVKDEHVRSARAQEPYDHQRAHYAIIEDVTRAGGDYDLAEQLILEAEDIVDEALEATNERED